MLQINDKLRIRKLDDNNLVIEVLKTINSEKKGIHDEWRWYGYYGNLQTALSGVLKKLLFDSVEEELTIQTIINKIDDAEYKIIKAMKEGE